MLAHAERVEERGLQFLRNGWAFVVHLDPHTEGFGARGAGYALLQLSFDARGAQLRLAHVDPMPSLLDQGAVDAVADLLERSVARPP